MMSRFKDHKQFRLPYFNYASTGWYFITIGTWQRNPWFGTVVNGVMQLSDLGRIADEHLREIPKKFPFATVDAHIVMPDHVHCLLGLTNEQEKRYVTERPFRLRPRSVSTVIGGYKSSVTARARKNHFEDRLWQERFFDRVVRAKQEWYNIQTYINENPARWQRRMDEHTKNML